MGPGTVRAKALLLRGCRSPLECNQQRVGRGCRILATVRRGINGIRRAGLHCDRILLVLIIGAPGFSKTPRKIFCWNAEGDVRLSRVDLQGMPRKRVPHAPSTGIPVRSFHGPNPRPSPPFAPTLRAQDGGAEALGPRPPPCGDPKTAGAKDSPKGLGRAPFNNSAPLGGWAEPRTTARSWRSVNHPGHHAEQGTWGSRTRKHRETGCGRPEDRGVWTAKTVKRPPQQPAQPQYTNYWALLTRKRHTLPHPAQPQHTNHWAPRTRR